MKNCVIIGLGNFGYHTALALHEAGVDLLCIDTSEEFVSLYKDELGVTVQADATKMEQLESLQIQKFDAAVVAVGQDITASILISLHLQDLGIPNVIVRAISAEHARVLEKIGVVEIVNPERDSAVRVANKIMMTNVVDYLPLGGEYGIVEVSPPQSFIGKSLFELQLTSRFECQLIGIKSYETSPADPEREVCTATRIAPRAEDMIEVGSKMLVLGKQSDIVRLQSEE